jgi:thiosulfate dehydrogenase
MLRIGSFLFGLVVGAVILAPLGYYLFARFGGFSMTTSAKPLPLEKILAHAALYGSIGNAAKIQNPLAVSDANMLAGARVYRNDCEGCHGLPGRPETPMAKGENPPPQFFEADQMVTTDPQGVTYWKVSNGIRFSGMPGFAKTIPGVERWQVTLLLANLDKLPPSVKVALVAESPLEHDQSQCKP